MSGLDLAVIRARAARHARLERDAARDITLAEVSAAICSADDVPVLLGEIGRLARMVGEAHRTIRSLLAMDELDADSLDEPDEPDIPTRLGQVSEGLCRQPNPDGQLCAYERPCPHHAADPATWHVTACVHQSITAAQADGLFDTLADAAHGWEPAGVDVDVSGGPCCCRESPAAVARVVDAAREVARVLRPAVSRPSRALVAAVDALEEVAGHVAAVDLDLPCTVDGCQRARPCPTHDHHRAGVPAEPGEPDADPATERDFDQAAAAAVPVAVVGAPPWQVHDSPPPTHGAPAAEPADGPDQERELDAARAELAEVTAERDRYRQSLPVEAQDYWYWRQRAETAEARVDELADAHVEIARLTDGWRTTDHLRDEWRQRADDATADLDAALVTIGALRDELATARAEAAADALAWVRQELDPDDDMRDVLNALDTWAVEVRAGRRTISTGEEQA